MNVGLGVIIRWRGRHPNPPSLTQSISHSLTFIQLSEDHGHTATILNTPGNIAYYPLDTSTPIDYSSEAPDLTYHGTVSTLQSGAGSHTGKSTDFGGTGYATVTDNLFDFSNTFTLSAFVKITDPPRDSAYTVIASGSYLSGIVHVVDYALYAEGPGGTFQFAVTNSSGATVTVDSNTVPIPGSWYQIQVTYDGAFINIYVNGILENQVAQTGVLLSVTGRTFSVGALADGSQAFPGSIDDIAAFNTALNSTQLSLILTTAGDPKVRVSQNVIETLSSRQPKARISQNVIETLSSRQAKVRVSQNVIEVLRSPYSILNQSINQSLTLNQSNSLNIIYLLSSSQALLLTQRIQHELIVKQSLIFVQSATAFIVKTVHQSLTFTQIVTSQQTNIHQNLSFSSTTSINAIHNLTNNQSLIFNQKAQLLRTLSQTLTFTSIATQSIIRSSHSSLIFSQATTNTLTKRINQTLTFNQSVHQNTIRSFLTTQHLTLIEGYNKQLPISLFPASVPIPSLPIPINQLPNISTIFTNNPIVPQQANNSIFIPSATVIVKPKKCIFIIACKDLSVVLPCPIFGDSQGFTSTTTIKRTMTGGYYTYNKINQLQKLSYTFNIYKNKMYEVRNFLIKYMSSVIFVQNHKSELWLAYITNNPLTFTSKSRWGGPCPEEGGEKVELVLELQGARLL